MVHLCSSLPDGGKLRVNRFLEISEKGLCAVEGMCSWKNPGSVTAGPLFLDILTLHQWTFACMIWAIARLRPEGPQARVSSGSSMLESENRMVQLAKGTSAWDN